MLDYNCYLLYSSYSEICSKFINLLQKTNLVTKHNIIYVPLDTRKNRDLVTNSSVIEISRVPILLFVYNDGTIEKYHSQNLWEWLEQYTPQLEDSEDKITPLNTSELEVDPPTEIETPTDNLPIGVDPPKKENPKSLLEMAMEMRKSRDELFEDKK